MYCHLDYAPTKLVLKHFKPYIIRRRIFVIVQNKCYQHHPYWWLLGVSWWFSKQRDGLSLVRSEFELHQDV